MNSNNGPAPPSPEEHENCRPGREHVRVELIEPAVNEIQLLWIGLHTNSMDASLSAPVSRDSSVEMSKRGCDAGAGSSSKRLIKRKPSMSGQAECRA